MNRKIKNEDTIKKILTQLKNYDIFLVMNIP